MSFRSLLSQRCDILRMTTQDVDGAPVYDWGTHLTGIRCRVDLSFSRRGKDPEWSQEAGRVSDRTGVAFFLPGVDVQPGDRIVMTGGGINGTFSLEGALDTVIGRRGKVHHVECGVEEVATPLGRGAA